jgi:predicted PurR-regulated permease PerM
LTTVTNKTLSFSFFSSTFNTISSTVLYFLVIILYIFLLLLYRHLIVQFLIKSFSEDKEKVYVILNKTRYVIKSYLLGLIIEMFIVAFMNCIGFFILGVKYALLLGIIGAILNLVPYLGIFIACILSMLITFTTNSGATVIGVAIVLLIVHLVDGNFLFPRIVGSKVKMNALATILGVIIGSSLWGIPGMFLAIPIIAIMKGIFEEVEGLQPWCTLLGDDVAVKVSGRTSIKKLTNTLRRKKSKT